MDKTIRIFILAFVLAIYFLLFNALASFDLSSFSETLDVNDISSSTIEQASFGDSVEVTSFHDGWFWDIRSSHYTDYKDSTIYFLGFVPLPLMIHNFNLFYIHLIVGVIMFIILLSIIFSERGYYG